MSCLSYKEGRKYFPRKTKLLFLSCSLQYLRAFPCLIECNLLKLQVVFLDWDTKYNHIDRFSDNYLNTKTTKGSNKIHFWLKERKKVIKYPINGQLSFWPTGYFVTTYKYLLEYLLDTPTHTMHFVPFPLFINIHFS